MYELPNRKQRRRIMKEMGILKKKSTLSHEDWLKETSKAIALGKEMSRQKTEDILRKLEEQEAEKNVSE